MDAHATDHDEAHPHVKYFNIWFILLAVTIAEVIVAQVAIPKWVMWTTLGAMALYKAVMVAAYFMHLKFEKPTMWIIAMAPLIFGVILAIGTYPDSEKGTKAFKEGKLDPWSHQGVQGAQGEPGGGHEPAPAGGTKHE
jgi:cytochrome c oxidase subunit 4